MAPIAFHLSGESPAKGLEVDLEPLQNIEDLQKVLANAWSVVKPEGYYMPMEKSPVPCSDSHV